MMQPGRNGNRYRFGFNGMEMDDEVKGTGNSYDYGARIYDPRIAKWMSVDPLQRDYTSLSPYVYVANSPLLLVEIGGKWFVKFDNPDDPSMLVFVAEEGDDLSTLEIQLGVEPGTLTKNVALQGMAIEKDTELSTELNVVEQVANINNYLQTMGPDEATNCATASANCSGNVKSGWTGTDEFRNELKTDYDNISFDESQIGDIINYSLSDEYLDNRANEQLWSERGADPEKWRDVTTEEFKKTDEWKLYKENLQRTRSAHFTTILLKEKDGSGPAQVLEKGGGTKVKISDYPGGVSSSSGRKLFETKPINNDETPIYRKNN